MLNHDSIPSKTRSVSRTAAKLLLAAAFAMATACERQGRDIRIGLLALMEGEYATASGQPSLQAARLAVKEINDSGGILVDGRRHRLVLAERTHGVRPDAAASEARASINLDRIDVLIGPQLSGLATAAAAVAEESGVPMISPMASNPVVTAGRRYVFRMAFLDEFQGSLLASFARDDLRAARAAVMYDVALPYSADIARLFSETFQRLGGVIAATETFTSDQVTGFGASMRRIAAQRPEVILFPVGSPTAIKLIAEARRQGITAYMLGSDTWDLTTIAPLTDADSSFVVHQWHPDIQRDQVVRFVTAWRAAHGEGPRATAALTYDAIQVAARAIARAGSLDGDRIADAIAATPRFEGASGSIEFAGRHDPRRSGVLSMLRDGKHSLVRVVASDR